MLANAVMIRPTLRTTAAQHYENKLLEFKTSTGSFWGVGAALELGSILVIYCCCDPHGRTAEELHDQQQRPTVEPGELAHDMRGLLGPGWSHWGAGGWLAETLMNLCRISLKGPIGSSQTRALRC
jgi:hypothetical protein